MFVYWHKVWLSSTDFIQQENSLPGPPDVDHKPSVLPPHDLLVPVGPIEKFPERPSVSVGVTRSVPRYEPEKEDDSESGHPTQGLRGSRRKGVKI
jgi:hypothetical protein